MGNSPNSKNGGGFRACFGSEDKPIQSKKESKPATRPSAGGGGGAWCGGTRPSQKPKDLMPFKDVKFKDGAKLKIAQIEVLQHIMSRNLKLESLYCQQVYDVFRPKLLELKNQQLLAYLDGNNDIIRVEIDEEYLTKRLVNLGLVDPAQQTQASKLVREFYLDAAQLLQGETPDSGKSPEEKLLAQFDLAQTFSSGEDLRRHKMKAEARKVQSQVHKKKRLISELKQTTNTMDADSELVASINFGDSSPDVSLRQKEAGGPAMEQGMHDEFYQEAEPQINAFPENKDTHLTSRQKPKKKKTERQKSSRVVSQKDLAEEGALAFDDDPKQDPVLQEVLDYEQADDFLCLEMENHEDPKELPFCFTHESSSPRGRIFTAGRQPGQNKYDLRTVMICLYFLCLSKAHMKARYISQLYFRPSTEAKSQSTKKKVQQYLTKLNGVIEAVNKEGELTCTKAPEPVNPTIKPTNFTQDNEDLLEEVELDSEADLREIFTCFSMISTRWMPKLALHYGLDLKTESDLENTYFTQLEFWNKITESSESWHQSREDIVTKIMIELYEYYEADQKFQQDALDGNDAMRASSITMLFDPSGRKRSGGEAHLALADSLGYKKYPLQNFQLSLSKFMKAVEGSSLLSNYAFSFSSFLYHVHSQANSVDLHSFQPVTGARTQWNIQTSKADLFAAVMSDSDDDDL